MAVLKGSVFWTLGLYSCPNSSKLHDGCLSNFQICPSGCLLHSGRLLFLAKSDLLVGNSIRSVIRYLRVHDVCIFVPMRLFRKKAPWVYQAYDTVQLNLFYMMIGLTHHEKQTSCT